MPPGPPSYSVVIDTFNQAPFIAQAVESALAQVTPRTVEVLVVDDGSTDATPEVLGRFGDRIRVVRQPNQGQAGALNTGIVRALGDWVVFLDGDDRWAPGRLAELDRVATGDVAFAFTRQINAEGEELALDPPAALGTAYRARGRDADWLRQGLAPWLPPTSGIAARRDLLARIGPIPTSYRIAADGWLQIALVVFGRGVDWITTPQVELRIHAHNQWSGRSDFDPAVASARRALYEELAAAVTPLAARAGRDASGLEAALRAQAQEFAIWEHILHGRRAQALALAASWSPPPSIDGARQRAFRKLHTLVATITPVEAYAALRRTWRGSPLARLLRTGSAE